MNTTLQTIFNRKSVRSYTDALIADEQLLMLVKAGMAAPSAVDKRPCDFIVVPDKAVLKTLADVLPHAKMTEHAAAAIIVTGDLTRQHGGQEASYWILDCSAATENILLAAESLGLGAVWTAVFPDQGRIAAVRMILNIPTMVMPFNVIPLGVPASSQSAKNKFDAKRIHRNAW